VFLEHAAAGILIRGHRVLLDSDLAALYGVTTKRLNEQVCRNIDRFPEDFIFAQSDLEVAALGSQLATLKPGCGAHRKYLPGAERCRSARQPHNAQRLLHQERLGRIVAKAWCS
jgi:ORF6N domain